MLVSQGKKDEAQALLQKLQNQLPSSADAAMSIGDFYVALNQSNEALSAYRKALSDSPKNLEIKKRILDLYLLTNQTQVAAGLDGELMRDAPKDVLVRVGHGRLLMAQGNFSQAIDQLQRAVADAADSPQAHYFLAMAYWKSGTLPRAGSELCKQPLAIQLTRPHAVPLVLDALARLSLTLGNPANAETYAAELVQKSPANAAYRQFLAEALAQQRHVSEAEAQTLIAKQLAPKRSDLFTSAWRESTRRKRNGQKPKKSLR